MDADSEEVRAFKPSWVELALKSSKRQDHANRRNAGEEITLENKLKQIGTQQRLRERTLNTEIRLIVEKQRRLGHRTFSLPDEIDVLPSAPATPLRKRIFRASKIDKVEWDARSVLTDSQSLFQRHPHLLVGGDARSTVSDQTYIKQAPRNRYHMMDVLEPGEEVTPAALRKVEALSSASQHLKKERFMESPELVER